MVVRNAFNKDVFREITRTIERFLGLFAIIALGVSFFAGIGTTGSKMKHAQDIFLTDHSLTDIQIISNYGLNDNDIDAIAKTKGVLKVQPAYNLDAIVTINAKTILIKAISFETENFNEQINKPDLISGRIPTKGNEILVEPNFLAMSKLSIGDNITLESGKDEDIRKNLKTKQFKIVGTANSPMYISDERGTGSVGSGKIDCYVMFPKDAFTLDYYPEAFVSVDGASELFSFGTEYENAVEKIVKNLEKVEDVRVVARLNELTEKAYRDIARQEKNLEEMKLTARVEFDDNITALGFQILDVEKAKEELRNERKNYERQLENLKLNKSKINSALLSVRDGLSSIENNKNSLNKSLSDVKAGFMQLDNNENDLLYEEDQIYKNLSMYPEMLKEALAEIEQGKLEIEEQRLILTENERSIHEGILALDLAQADIEKQESQVLANLREIQSFQNQILIGMTVIDKNINSISSGKTELENAVTDLSLEKTTSIEDIEIATAQLKKAREDLDDLNEVDWYILDRDTNYGFLTYKEDADKMTSIGKVFPLMFFLVAALVCLTTMTRLVEEKRMEIGTLKALGYKNFKILSKYIIYALTPTVLGGIFGGYFGMIIYPNIIMTAYTNMYLIPKSELYIDYNYWAFGILLGSITTVAATINTCYGVLKEDPASLLRPKAEKTGKKTFIESIKIIWNNLTFSQKITMRNLIKYKKRLLMTIIGVGGCTALIVTGFGLRNSIEDLIRKQYGSIFKYDMKISFSDSVKDKDIDAVTKMISNSKTQKDYLVLKEKNIEAGNMIEADEQATLIVPKNMALFDSFLGLKDRVSQKEYTVSDDGAVISEKLAKLFKVSEGDNLTLKDGDDRYTIKVDAICENYFNHYIYMSETYYKEVFNEDIEYSAIYSKLNAVSTKEETDSFIKEVLDKKSVSGVVQTNTAIENMQKVIDSLDIVIIVLVISAGILAFVVLYNLTVINIKEREREIATLIVLGFRDKETENYIYKENIILTAMGIVFGLFMGYILHSYIILTVESRMMMFSKQIWASSYAYSVVITMLFAILVNKVTSKKLKKIDMVEALKSVE